MITLTIQEDIKIGKSSFRNLEELKIFLWLYKKSEYVDLVHVSDDEVDSDVLALAKKTKVLPKSSFTNI